MASPADEPSSDRIAHFRILRQIGRGGQATVYLAEDTRAARQVALKVIDSRPGDDRTAFERFRREAAIASKLQDPGICTVYATGEDRGVLWIAMRYVEGQTIANEVATARSGGMAEGASFMDLSQPASPEIPASPDRRIEPPSGPGTHAAIERTLLLFEKTARALHVAHEAGIIHRDIKSGNIMVTNDGEPVILDFGLAQEVEGDQPTLTMTGDIMGTPAYMSPEQIAAQRVRIDRRTDVYSLGVSLYESLTLRRPFDEPTRDRLYQAILTKDPPDARELNPALPGDVGVVLETALEKDRDRRYQTALDFAEDLRRVRMHGDILAKPAGPMVRLLRWSRRNPALATSIVGLFVVLLTGLTVALVLLDVTRRERDAKEAQRLRADQNATEKTVALTEKQTALTEYERLADVKRLSDLLTEAGRLWPAEPDKVDSMRDWLRRATLLADGLPTHKAALAGLEALAAPYDDVGQANDRSAHKAERDALDPLLAKRADIEQQLLRAASQPASRSTATRSDSKPTSRAESAPTSRAGPRSPDDLRKDLALLQSDIARLETKIEERITWALPTAELQWKHETLKRLVADLERFIDQEMNKGTLASVRDRLSFAESVRKRTIDEHASRWDEAIRSIAAPTECPKYAGLRITPQIGLIPIGRDPASGLWEFSHLQTTAAGVNPMPEHGADGRLKITKDTGLVFVLIPGGTFTMGAVPASKDQQVGLPNPDPFVRPDQAPLQAVALDPFFLSKYEMSQGQWLRLVGMNPSMYGPGKNFGGTVVNLLSPVEQVSWEDCDRWLGRLGLILPTEAQWEYAARAGTTTVWWTGSSRRTLQTAANLADAFFHSNGGSPGMPYESWDDGYTVHAPVGSFAANAFGLHDVLGNVWEWCRDFYGDYDQPVRKGDGLRTAWGRTTRVTRGGGFTSDAPFAASAFRSYSTPDIRHGYLGVRPARSVSNP